MQSSAFRILSAIVTLLLIVTLAVLVALTLRSQPTVTIQPAPTSSPTLTPTNTATPFQTLGADLVVPEGGYRFQPLLGYGVTIQGAAVALTHLFSDTTAANISGSEQLSTIGLDARALDALGVRPDLSLSALLMQVAQPFINQTQAQASAVEMLTIGGVDAASVSLRGELDSAPIAGRIVVAQPEAERLFIAAATAPLATWTSETSAALDSVLQSVAFFAPQTAPTETAPTETAPAETAPAETAPTETAPTERPRPGATARQTPIAATPLATPSPTMLVVTIVGPASTFSATLTATPVVTITTLQVPTPTPSPVSRSTTQPWTVVTDGNWMNKVVVAGNTRWIATDGGALAWTRGSTTPVKFTSLNGLTDNHLTTVVDCALPDLGIIFGSNAGLQVVDPGAGGWRQLDSSNSELSYDDVVDLVCNPDAGYLVIGYARHGIDVFDEQSGEWRHLDRNSGLAFNNVQSLAVVGALDEIWVAGEDGVTVAAGADSTFYNAGNSPLESNRIGAIVADADRVVWLGGDGALYRVAGESWTVFNAEEVEDAGFPVRLITGLALAGDGELWLGDIDGTICRFDPATRTCTAAFRGELGMANAPLTHLTLDADGQLYFTTAGDGFSVYDGATWQRFARSNEGLRGNAVRAATIDPDGALWVVTDAGVQRVLGPDRSPTLTPDAPIELASIQAIYAASNGDIWIGGAGGAAVWNGSAWRVYTMTDGMAGEVVQAIGEDSRGRIWLGADAGVSIWNGESFFNLTRDTGLPSDDIRVLLEDGNAMWIGSAGGGLYRFERNQLEVLNVDNMNLPSDVITALALSGDGALLVGTDAGLVELRDGMATPLAALGERAITQVLVQDGATWVGTAADGLFYQSGEDWQQETTAGALPSNHVTALQAVDGDVWVGGATGGLARYRLPTEE
ncbi:MAG: hypothetical protein IAE81_10165 [Caldilineaceae bacterium]|nr:hypothetical protein [Caldilineaceae bacterium]